MNIVKEVRCETCLGMGYKGRGVKGTWKILTCRVCGGTGSVPANKIQRPRRTKQ